MTFKKIIEKCNYVVQIRVNIDVNIDFLILPDLEDACAASISWVPAIAGLASWCEETRWVDGSLCHKLESYEHRWNGWDVVPQCYMYMYGNIVLIFHLRFPF